MVKMLKDIAALDKAQCDVIVDEKETHKSHSPYFHHGGYRPTCLYQSHKDTPQ